ncbi:MAG: hypothetical protein HQL82_17330, partial [Magnetococcales bacterium]|nr:hypothetical protein [Magnetococcales bacterium]
TLMDSRALKKAALERPRKPPNQPAAASPAPPGQTAVEISGWGVPEQQLLDLAKRRALAVKEVLVKHYRVAPERLFICLPEVDRKHTAQPRVELTL